MFYKHHSSYVLSHEMPYFYIAGLRLDWSNCGQYLAVGGFTRLPNLQCQNEIHFYSPSGQLRHWVSVPSQVR